MAHALNKSYKVQSNSIFSCGVLNAAYRNKTAQAHWHTITAAAAQQVYKMSNGVKRTERHRKPLK